jgi:hypothetical protein
MTLQFVGEWCAVHHSFHVCAYVGHVQDICRCGHPASEHGPEGCRSPFTFIGTDHVSPYACSCERYKEQDSDE